MLQESFDIGCPQAVDQFSGPRNFPGAFTLFTGAPHGLAILTGTSAIPAFPWFILGLAFPIAHIADAGRFDQVFRHLEDPEDFDLVRIAEPERGRE